MVDPQAALSALADIERTERRVFQAVFSGIAGPLLILWGAITALGYAAGQAAPGHAVVVWPSLDVLGFLAMLAVLRRRTRAMTAPQRGLAWRLCAGQVALITFGLAVVVLLGPFTGRQLDAFWPLLFMLGYCLAGLWVGRFFLLLGLAVAGLTAAGFWWAGPWFPAWLAVVDGGGLMLGGAWLCRQGARL